MRRWGSVAVAVLLVGLAGGCYHVEYPNPEDGRAIPPRAETPDSATPTVTSAATAGPTPSEGQFLTAEQLCMAAAMYVQTVQNEINSSRSADEATRQFVASFHSYAQKLRDLAPRAETDAQRAAIEQAATAADQLASEVDVAGTFQGVDSQPAVQATQDAFPDCELVR
jgi:hypothetical protein